MAAQSRLLASLYVVCWGIALWGIFSGVFGLYAIPMIAISALLDDVPRILDLALWVALIIVIPAILAMLLLICLPLCALSILLPYRRLWRPALLLGCIANYAGAVLGCIFAGPLLLAGYLPWDEGGELGILAVGSVLAFVAGYRSWRWQRAGSSDESAASRVGRG